ncbi:MAG: CRISPR type III-associated RAMP protein Csm3 [candidate division WS2 bacterium]|uniref:CRISPR system Cms endoribonuclease Csm3 n=1 Tax=Psychracetigena formicireducens TaxID=2986056 RepID=A0A9E2F103_PSYF1|nr:CRISPR type III-associated RAMP protein Csm3 [Candidatus Psychracetigena formicireducens]
MTDITLKGKIIVLSKIRTETALHIGGSKSGMDIGGVDNTVIKDNNGKPYIPGSSIKGKMRSLLEKAEGLATLTNLVWQKKPDIRVHLCNDIDCPACNIFGRSNAINDRADGNGQIIINNTTPTRLIVRDSFLIEESISENVRKNLELEWTEVKIENSIDRITSAANPRQQERVPRGAEFDFEMVFNIYQENDKKLFRKIIKSMQLLEDDYLGGSGSRGYGKIKFIDIKIFWNSNLDYEEGKTDINIKQPVEQGVLKEISERINDDKLLNPLFS